MFRFHWKFARLFGIIGVSIVLYLCLRIKTYTYRASILLPNVHPNEVWEFVADFGNMKYLNPTM